MDAAGQPRRARALSGGKPILMALYMSESTQTVETLSAAHAQVAAEIVRELAA